MAKELERLEIVGEDDLRVIRDRVLEYLAKQTGDTVHEDILCQNNGGELCKRLRVNCTSIADHGNPDRTVLVAVYISEDEQGAHSITEDLRFICYRLECQSYEATTPVYISFQLVTECKIKGIA